MNSTALFLNRSAPPKNTDFLAGTSQAIFKTLIKEYKKDLNFYLFILESTI